MDKSRKSMNLFSFHSVQVYFLYPLISWYIDEASGWIYGTKLCIISSAIL